MTEQAIEPAIKTYPEMLEIAKAVSPDADVRLTDERNLWEIHIPTDFQPAIELPENLKDTPAWKAFKEPDASYGDVLHRWGFRSGYRNVPLEGIAELYNLEKEICEIANNKLDELRKESKRFARKSSKDDTLDVRKHNFMFIKADLYARQKIADKISEVHTRWGV